MLAPLNPKGGSIQPSFHHHVHQGKPQTPLARPGRNQEVHPEHAAARTSHSTKGCNLFDQSLWDTP